MPKKQKSGLYRTKIKIGVDANGKDIYKWISGSTKAELERSRQDVLKHYITGDCTQQDMLFGQYAVQWYKAHKAPGLSPSSQESYRTALSKDILPVFGDRHLRAISANDIQIFLNQYADRSATKITYLTATLRGVFKQACADGIISRNPALYIQKPSASCAKEKYILTEGNRKMIESVCASSDNGAYLACMYYLGVRPGEARGLKWGDFDWVKNTVHIQRDIDYKAGGYAGALKTASSNRFVPIPSPLRDILSGKIGDDNEFLFRGENSGSALSKTTAERLWVSLMLECGLVETINSKSVKYRDCDIRSKYKPIFTPHTLRHNYITMCWENGIDVYTTMKLVGHKSIKTTIDVYTHLSDMQLKKAVDKVENMFSGKNSV